MRSRGGAAAAAMGAIIVAALTIGAAHAQSIDARLQAAEDAVRAAEQRPNALPAALRDQAEIFYRAGREQQAIDAVQRAIDLRSRQTGERAGELPVMLNNLGWYLTNVGRASEAVALFQRGIEIASGAPQIGPGAPVVGTLYSNLASARSRLGDAAGQAGAAAAAVRVREQVVARGGAPGQELAVAKVRLATAYSDQGRPHDAHRTVSEALAGAGSADWVADALIDRAGYGLAIDIPLAQSEADARRALALVEQTRGVRDPAAASAWFVLARVQQRAGRLRDCVELARRALALREERFGRDHPAVGLVVNALGRCQMDLGDYAAADAAFRRAEALFQRRFGPTDRDVAELLRNQALLAFREGRIDDAERLVRRAVSLRERAYALDHPYNLAFLNDAGLILTRANRLSESVPFLERAVRVNERAAGDSPELGVNLLNLSIAQRLSGQLDAAEASAQRALAINDRVRGHDSPTTASTLAALGAALQAKGQLAGAEARLREALAIDVQALGDHHTRAAQVRVALALVLEQAGRYAEALAALRPATAALAQRLAADPRGRERNLTAERDSYRGTFAAQVRIGGRLVARDPAVVDDMLTAAQLAHASAAGTALGQMADRLAAQGGEVGARLRRRTELNDRLAVGEAAMIANPQDAPRLRQEAAALRQQIQALNREIARLAPRFQAWGGRRELDRATASRLLGPSEALVAYLVAPDETTAFVIRPDGARAVTLAVGAAQLVDMVRRLRTGLEPRDVRTIADLPDYDLALANRLFGAVFAPLMPMLEGADHVFVVPDGALQSLPFAVLVASPGTPEGSDRFERLRNADWLARRFAFTVLPSIAALRALREGVPQSSADRPFVGFGDPALSGPAAGTRRVDAARLFAARGRGDVRVVRMLPPLPETADELLALARALGADRDAVYLRDRATVTQVRRTDLSRYRVVAFATHGLTSGDLPGYAEPGLILTPPERAAADDDGILTASAVMQLHLDADWVILSACNTAAADGTPGAEALSGLARAFFYAGSRSLLVSHWAVASTATVRLTTGIFREIARTPEIGRAEALRRSMLQLAGDREDPYLAHPMFWGPFVVVGEGGRTIAVPALPPDDSAE